MVDTRSSTVAFSGNRLLEAPRGVLVLTDQIEALIREHLSAILIELYKLGYRSFLSGGALGFDMLAAEEVVLLRDKYIDVSLTIVVPFEGQDAKYPKSEKVRYSKIIAAADATVLISENGYSNMAYHQRNDYLVRNSSMLIAYSNGRGGGTASTLNRAAYLGVDSINLYEVIWNRELEEQLSLDF
ncbi:MAG: SLOG family protein [Rikenellaceae bacterium]